MINATGNRITAEIRRQSLLNQAIARKQIEISTGKRIQQPSDDPVASARVASLRRAQADDATWTRNVDLGLSLSSQADRVMATVAEQMSRAQELAIAGANGALSSADRKTVADELRAISSTVGGLAATRSSLGQPLFSAGDPTAFRFNETSVFAPVPAVQESFEIGGAPLAQRLSDVADAVQSGNAANVGAALTNVREMVAFVSNVQGDIGVRAIRMDNIRENLITRGIDFAAERSTLEDTDLSEAIAQLNVQTLTLDAAQAAFARINRRNLIDILS